MQFRRTKEVQYAIDGATCPQSDEALRQLLHKHGVCPVSSSWVNIMNEEARKKARLAVKDNYICVCGARLYTVDGARVYGTTKEAPATGHAIPVTGQFLSFVAMTSDRTLLRWTGWFGPECELRNGHVVFFGCPNGCRWSLAHSSGHLVYLL